MKNLTNILDKLAWTIAVIIILSISYGLYNEYCKPFIKNQIENPSHDYNDNSGDSGYYDNN